MTCSSNPPVVQEIVLGGELGDPLTLLILQGIKARLGVQLGVQEIPGIHCLEQLLVHISLQSYELEQLLVHISLQSQLIHKFRPRRLHMISISSIVAHHTAKHSPKTLGDDEQAEPRWWLRQIRRTKSPIG